MASLSHSNILAIHDFGSQGGIAYGVMELLEGETLREKLRAPISQKQAVDYALQIARGLFAAHEKGIVHRDLKPENLFVTGEDLVKILDFGLAKKIETVADDDLSRPGAVMGTLGYMSSEQLRGLPVDHRSDIFAFGSILYELLSGRRAFKRAMAIETMAAILRDEPPALSESGRSIPATLTTSCATATKRDRGKLTFLPGLQVIARSSSTRLRDGFPSGSAGRKPCVSRRASIRQKKEKLRNES